MSRSGARAAATGQGRRAAGRAGRPGPGPQGRRAAGAGRVVLNGVYFTDRSGDAGRDEQRQRVGPGQQLVLLPPALHHQADVEAQHERHRDRLALRAEVLPHLLEHPGTRHTSLAKEPRPGDNALEPPYTRYGRSALADID